jgi:hypothetical protein
MNGWAPAGSPSSERSRIGLLRAAAAQERWKSYAVKKKLWWPLCGAGTTRLQRERKQSLANGRIRPQLARLGRFG